MTLWTSLSFRLAMLYALFFAASVAALGGVFYWVSVRIPLEQAEWLVRAEADDLADTYIVDGRAALVAKLDARVHHISARKPFHALLAADGTVVTANLPSWPSRVAAGWVRIEADVYRDGDEDDHEALTLDHAFADGTRLLVGRDVEDVRSREELLRGVAGALLALAVLLSLTGGALMSRVIGGRLDAMSRTARRVIDGDLSGRIPVKGTRDDFDRLAETLNAMLDRIEQLLESIRRVSDNVAHELRTPLARVRGDLEALRSAGGADRAALLDQAVAEADQLERLFDAILRIARIEGNRHMFRPRPVDLSALARDAAELYEPLAAARNQILSISVEPDLTTQGDRDLLFQAICNLIDNAVKFTPPGGEIDVAAVARDDGPVVEVHDSGPGIAADQRERVTERFYRGDGAADVPGAGLGLTFAEAVARLHGVALRIGSPRRGALVGLAFPRDGSGDGSPGRHP